MTSKIAIVITLPEAARPEQQAVACHGALADAPLRQLVERVHVFVPAGAAPISDDPMIDAFISPLSTKVFSDGMDSSS